MKKFSISLAIILSAVSLCFAGGKEKHFIGKAIFLNASDHVVIVKDETKEIEFLVTGKVMRGNAEIAIHEINTKVPLDVTYTKKRKRFIATMIMEKSAEPDKK